MNKDSRNEIIKNFQINDKDTGSTRVQVALLTERIKHLTEHLKAFSKDFSCKKTLLMLVARRRKYLQQIKQENLAEYQSVVSKLSLKA